MNKMAEGHPFFSVGAYNVSEDGNLLAFSTDTTGFRQYNLFIKDLRIGEITEKIAERVTSVAWANDNKTLFYGQDEVTKRSNKIFRYALGGGGGKTDYAVRRKDELYNTGVGKMRSKGYIVVSSTSSTTSEMRYLPADKPGGELKLFLPRKENHEYYIDHLGDNFYIRTNDQGKFPARDRPGRRPLAEELERNHPAPQGRDARRR